MADQAVPTALLGYINFDAAACAFDIARDLSVEAAERHILRQISEGAALLPAYDPELGAALLRVARSSGTSDADQLVDTVIVAVSASTTLGARLNHASTLAGMPANKLIGHWVSELAAPRRPGSAVGSAPSPSVSAPQSARTSAVHEPHARVPKLQRLRELVLSRAFIPVAIGFLIGAVLALSSGPSPRSRYTPVDPAAAPSPSAPGN